MIGEHKIQEITYNVFQKKFADLNIIGKKKGQSFEFDKLRFKMDCEFSFKENNSISNTPTVNLHYRTTGSEKERLFNEIVSTFDDTWENAIEKVVNEFIELDFSVLSKYYCAGKDDDFQNEVKRLEAVHYNPEQNTTLGWEVYLSKVRAELHDKVEFTTASQTDIFNHLHGLINDYFFPIKEERYLKCWVTKTNKPELFADCRVDMKDWNQGRDMLYTYGEAWNEKETQSRKQCILIIPKNLEELKNGKQILEQVKEYAKNYKPPKAEHHGKWWKFWK